MTFITLTVNNNILTNTTGQLIRVSAPRKLSGQMHEWTIREHCTQLFQGYQRRPPGRPRQSWTQTIEKDLSALSIGLHMTWRRAQDHQQWQMNCGSGYAPRWGLPLIMMVVVCSYQ